MLVCHRRSLLSSIIGGVLDQQFMTKWPSHCLWPHQAQLYDRPHRRYSTSSRPVLLPSHTVLSCPVLLNGRQNAITTTIPSTPPPHPARYSHFIQRRHC